MTQAQFKVGSVYRCRDGQVVRLLYMEHWHDRNSVAQAVAVNGNFARGSRQLTNGAYPYTTNENHGGHLLPGELTQRDGQWVAVEDAKANPDEMTLGELMADLLSPAVAPEPNRPRLTWADAKPFDAFKGYQVTSDCASEPLARGLHSPDLKATSHLIEPAHGSAFLKG